MRTWRYGRRRRRRRSRRYRRYRRRRRRRRSIGYNSCCKISMITVNDVLSKMFV
jgi:hypothetical protein